jgi:hypothetical protein
MDEPPSSPEVQGEDTRANTHIEALVDTLQERNRFLREELARKDTMASTKNSKKGPTIHREFIAARYD